MSNHYSDFKDNWTSEEIWLMIDEYTSEKQFREYIAEICLDTIRDNDLLKSYEKEKETTPEKVTPLPLQIAILNKIGFFDLEVFKNLNTSQKENLISILLNRPDKRGIRGNINVLQDGSNENAHKYTSHKKEKEVNEILQNL